MKDLSRRKLKKRKKKRPYIKEKIQLIPKCLFKDEVGVLSRFSWEAETLVYIISFLRSLWESSVLTSIQFSEVAIASELNTSVFSSAQEKLVCLNDVDMLRPIGNYLQINCINSITLFPENSKENAYWNRTPQGSHKATCLVPSFLSEATLLRHTNPFYCNLV